MSLEQLAEKESLERKRMPGTFHAVVKVADLEDKKLRGFVVNGWPVVVAFEDGVISTVINRCTHAASAFAPDGRVRRGTIMCPLHGARFRLENGECIGASYKPLLIFAHRTTADGWLEIEVPDEAPGMEHLPVKPLS